MHQLLSNNFLSKALKVEHWAAVIHPYKEWVLTLGLIRALGCAAL